VGRPAGHVELKIVDPNGNRLEAGQTGRIMMRNPQRFAYHGAAASGSGAAYDDEGYASLGDIGYVDDDGYLYLTDRESNLIISGGVNVYPQEAEITLMGHPAISDVAVVGIAHRELGEEAKALVLLRPEALASAELATELFDYCRKHLSLYKCPRSIDFVSALPRNDLGKLVKHQIEASLRVSSGHYRS
jgi:acyl-CoA synthetase (AMP-forming)/AMP-acid ligase II